MMNQRLRPAVLNCACTLLAFATLLLAPFPGNAAPIFYLTWEHDPARSMVIKWLADDDANAAVEWRAIGAASWSRIAPQPAARLNSRWSIHGVELLGLAPAADYEFRFASLPTVYKFRTAPADLGQPLRFVEGGDVYYSRKVLDPINALAAKFEPAFAVLGGDLAYSHTNNVEQTDRWVDYFASWMENAVTPSGRHIPMLVAIGNHEVAGNWGQTPEQAVSFYKLFPLPGRPGYAALDFGNYLSLILLDSGHTAPVAGAQTTWLKSALAARSQVPHVFPAYHVTAYPSFRVGETNASGRITFQIQTNWCPVFDQFRLPLVFEHHDHAFKRTFPLRAGHVDPLGTVYLGDGAWGVDPRPPKLGPATWYLAKAAAVRHFYVVTLYAEARHVLAVDENGRVFDELYQRVR